VSVFFQDNALASGHRQRALRGGAASVIARSVNAVIQIGSVLCLARLLSPEDYGLVGMVMAATGFANLLVDLGSRDAIVQRRNIDQADVGALFWLTQLVGVGVAVLVASGGPLLSWFYGEPRLTSIAAVSAVTFITAALAAQPYALLRRAMMFRELGIVEVTANLLAAAVAIALALDGAHYWALAIRPVVASFLLAVGVWLQCRWLPPKPAMTPRAKEMLRFGMNITGFTMTDFAGRSADRVAVGYRFGAATLGYYQTAAFVYDNVIDIIISSLYGVAVASLSKLHDDAGELRRSWGKALSTLAFYAMPVFGLLTVVSRDVIVLLLGTKWAASGVLLSVIALRGIPQTVERTAGWLHVTAGRTDRWMRWGAFTAAAQFAALFVGLPFGPIGVVTAHTVLTFALFVPAIAYAGQPLQIGAGDMLGVTWRPMAGSLASIGIGVALSQTVLADQTMLARTAWVTGVYLVSYVAIVVGLLRVRTPIRAALSLCDNLLPTGFTQNVRASEFMKVKGYEGS
jgi:PST family polysaccharide transporter